MIANEKRYFFNRLRRRFFATSRFSLITRMRLLSALALTLCSFQVVTGDEVETGLKLNWMAKQPSRTALEAQIAGKFQRLQLEDFTTPKNTQASLEALGFEFEPSKDHTVGKTSMPDGSPEFRAALFGKNELEKLVLDFPAGYWGDAKKTRFVNIVLAIPRFEMDIDQQVVALVINSAYRQDDLHEVVYTRGYLLTAEKIDSRWRLTFERHAQIPAAK